MIEKLSKGFKITQEEGYRELIGRAFNYYVGDVYDNSIREYFPVVPIGYNGVNVLAFRVSDLIMPANSRYMRPSYEAAICRQLRLWDLAGCDVCVLGAGWGVTSVVAAHQTAPTGQVISYEASEKYVTRAEKTAIINNCADRINVRYGCVGPAINIYGGNDAPNIDLEGLPDVDCYVIDIEGAEFSVLDDFPHRPKYLLVESHGLYKSPTDRIKKKLRKMDYSITDCRIAEIEPNIREQCEKNDVYVISAKLN